MRHCNNCHGTGESGHGAKTCNVCHGFGLVFGPASSPPENLRAECDALKVKLAAAEARSARTFDGFLALRAKLTAAETLLRELAALNGIRWGDLIARLEPLIRETDTFLSSVRDA